jgi:hypothetical protein
MGSVASRQSTEVIDLWVGLLDRVAFSDLRSNSRESKFTTLDGASRSRDL